MSHIAEIIEKILNQSPRAYTLITLLEEIERNEKIKYLDQRYLEEAMQEVIQNGKAKICITSTDPCREEIGIISTKSELWEKSYENMKKKLDIVLKS